MIKVAQNFLVSHGIDIKVCDWNGTLGNYDKNNDTIRLNIRKIKKVFKQDRKNMPYAKSIIYYIELITCHELGHRDDEEESLSFIEIFNQITGEYEEKYFLLDHICEEVKEKILNICINKEITAWELGKRYVDKNRLEDYNLMNSEYIESKKKDFDIKIMDLIKDKIEIFKLKLKREVFLNKS